MTLIRTVLSIAVLAAELAWLAVLVLVVDVAERLCRLVRRWRTA